MKEAPSDKRFPFCFYGSEPSDWFESEGEGYAYEVCFQESFNDAERAKIEQTLSTALQEHGKVFDVQWAGPWLLFRLEPSSEERHCVRSMFTAARTALQTIHASFTITEAINTAASEDDSDWNLFTIEAHPIPSPGPHWRSSVPEIAGRIRYQTTIDDAPAARSFDEIDRSDNSVEDGSGASREVLPFEVHGILHVAAPSIADAAERARRKAEEGLARSDNVKEHFRRLLHDRNGVQLGITHQGTAAVLFNEQLNDLRLKHIANEGATVRADDREALVPQQQTLWAVSLPYGNKHVLYKHPTAQVNAAAYLANDLLAIGLNNSLLLARRFGDQLEVLARYSIETLLLHALAHGLGLGCLDGNAYRVYAIDEVRLKEAGSVRVQGVVEFIDNELIIADGNDCIALVDIDEAIARAREGSDEQFPEPHRWGAINPEEVKEPATLPELNENGVEHRVRNLLHAPAGSLRFGKPDCYWNHNIPSHLSQIYEGASIRAMGTHRRFLVLQQASKQESRLLLVEGEKEIVIREGLSSYVNIYEVKLRDDGRAALRTSNYVGVEEIEFETQKTTVVFQQPNFRASLFAYLSPEQVIVMEGTGNCILLQRQENGWKPTRRFHAPGRNYGMLAGGHKQQVLALGCFGSELVLLGLRDGVARVLATPQCSPTDLQSVNDKIYAGFLGHYFPLEQLDELLDTAFAPDTDETLFPQVEELPIEAPARQQEHSEEEESNE